MTVGVVVKVHAGLVLASDSATSLSVGRQSDQVSVYKGAENLIRLHPELPIGLLTWGTGAIGGAPIPTLARDLRHRFLDGAKGWALDPMEYRLEGVAERVREFFFEQKCEEVHQGGGTIPDFGLCVAGYSAKEALPEVWEIMVESGNCPSPKLLRPREESGVSWFGQAEPFRRLVLGVSNELRPALVAAGVNIQDIGKVVQLIKANSEVPFAPPAMPVLEAVELAQFLVETAVMYDRFSPGTTTVGGAIEMAVITKHHGFNWWKRKDHLEPLREPWVQPAESPTIDSVAVSRSSTGRKKKKKRSAKKNSR